MSTPKISISSVIKDVVKDVPIGADSIKPVENINNWPKKETIPENLPETYRENKHCRCCAKGDMSTRTNQRRIKEDIKIIDLLTIEQINNVPIIEIKPEIPEK